MTPEERENPRVINGSRKRRIALGSCNSIEEVKRLIKQFEETSKMMRMVTTGGAKKMMQMMQQAKRRR